MKRNSNSFCGQNWCGKNGKDVVTRVGEEYFFSDLNKTNYARGWSNGTRVPLLTVSTLKKTKVVRKVSTIACTKDHIYM